MKKLLVTFALLCSVALVDASTYLQIPNPQKLHLNALQPAELQDDQSCSQGKTIEDPAEYNPYIAAINTPDPVQRAAALEAFIEQYPNSVAKVPALQTALEAYQQSNNTVEVEETIKRILQLDPDNVIVLAVDAYKNRVKIESGDLQAISAARDESQRGIQALDTWSRPCEMPQEEYNAKRAQMTAIFNGSAAMAALKSGDYTAAQQYYLKAIELDPSIANYSQLGSAAVQMNPADVKGFWYLAKAVALAQAANSQPAAQQIADYGKIYYRNYHGNEEGWGKLVSDAANQVSVPEGFTISARPTDCALIVTVAEQNDPGTLSFSDWEMVLSHRDCSQQARPAADKIWKFIQDKQRRQLKTGLTAKQKNAGVKTQTVKLLLSVKVISTTKDTIQAAITDKNQKANVPDLQITLEKPAATPPAKGSEIQIAGLFTDYTSDPFMFIMKNGELRPAKPAVRKKRVIRAMPHARQPEKP